jgi:hypothetical protein
MFGHYFTITQVSIFLSLILVFCVAEPKRKPGDRLFTCSPKSFTFSLNFNGQCPGNIASSLGIDGTDCFFVPDPNYTSPLVVVKLIQVIEVNLDLSNLSVENLNGDFEDGFTWKYESVTAGELSDEQEIPGGIQVNIRGQDEDGNMITNSVIIDYSNSEDGYPVLEVGNRIGWIVIVSQASLCVYPMSMKSQLSQKILFEPEGLITS